MKSLLFCCLWLVSTAVMAQTNKNWQDTLLNRTRLLRELVQEQNYEDAQVEAGELRAFLKRNYIHYPPAVLGLVSGIYLHNKDRNSGLLLLGEAEQDAKRDKNPATQAALLTAIIKEHDRWGNEERANVCRGILQTVQDSLAARLLAQRTHHFEKKIDSLQSALNTAVAVKSNTVTLDRYKALTLVGIAAFVILALVVAQLNTNSRWQRKWQSREQEWSLSHAVHDLPPPVTPPDQQPTGGEPISAETAVRPAGEGQVTAYSSGKNDFYSMYAKEPRMALVVEPNRQIAIYVRSLLSSNFEVTIADSAAEALKLAHEVLPDLIVCDAQLNGQEGIDIVRQIKLSERTNHIPVVLLSRHFGNDGRLDALRAGADAWFTRPMHSDEFSVTVKHLLDGQKSKHEDFARFLQLYFTGQRPAISDRFIADTMSFIEMNLANIDFMPDEIARKMQLPNVLFVRKLLALTGKDPGQLIRELRLEKARFLLENRAGTPQAISAMVGYANPGTISKAFKDYFGDNTMLLTTGNS